MKLFLAGIVRVVYKSFQLIPLIGVGLLMCLSSCISYKSLINYDEFTAAGDPSPIRNFEPIVLQPNDVVEITVSAQEEDMVAMFNQAAGYELDQEGTIKLPLLGKVMLAGNTLSQASDKIIDGLKKYYLEPPTVNVRLANFNIIIHGEVNSPGMFNMVSERVSMIDAITMAGDFTDYSMRDSILVIREVGDVRTFGYVNFNSENMFDSPYFYLRQNDVVYVKPLKRKTGTLRGQSDRLLPYVSITISLIFFLTAILNRL